jgi:formylglycine-generating enzyme required for sulfatase activity
MSRFLLLISLLVITQTVGAQKPMARIEGGAYTPLFGTANELVPVPTFYMDETPVTQTEFLEFVKKHPEWRKSSVLRLFADQHYLKTWESDTTLGSQVNPNAPVTNVSWFAASAYAKSVGKRLPTTDEWEFVAMASATLKDARKDSLYTDSILSWYETPQTFNNSIRKGEPNLWGVHDLFGLVWEWTEDFNSVLITGESRGDMDSNNALFCGGGAVGASDLMNYAAFMRYAFKGSLKARFAVQNLGFRCVKSEKEL